MITHDYSQEVMHAEKHIDLRSQQIKSATAVRDFAGESYREACRLHQAALDAHSAAVRTYFEFCSLNRNAEEATQ